MGNVTSLIVARGLRLSCIGGVSVLQLLDLAKENAALKTELRRIGGQVVALEHALELVLHKVADSASASDDEPPNR
jgi:hypothetical protein